MTWVDRYKCVVTPLDVQCTLHVRLVMQMLLDVMMQEVR